VVQRIGWHSTMLESAADGSMLIVPNSDMSTVPVRPQGFGFGMNG